MADTDWANLALTGAVSLVSGIGGLVVGAWRWGRREAQREQHLKEDYNLKIGDLREEMRHSVIGATTLREAVVSEFRDTFAALRQRINDVELTTEREFVRNEEFKEFREEYREDTREIKRLISSITRPQ